MYNSCFCRAQTLSYPEKAYCGKDWLQWVERADSRQKKFKLIADTQIMGHNVLSILYTLSEVYERNQLINSTEVTYNVYQIIVVGINVIHETTIEDKD